MLSIGKIVARSVSTTSPPSLTGERSATPGSGESPGSWLGGGGRAARAGGRRRPRRPTLGARRISAEGEVRAAGRVDQAKRVAGFDLTWSAPKSVSLLFGLSDPAASAMVRGLHEDAVGRALGYLEGHAWRGPPGCGR